MQAMRHDSEMNKKFCDAHRNGGMYGRIMRCASQWQDEQSDYAMSIAVD